MKKKILLLDTNFSAKPIYDYLCRTGAEVFVVGGKPHDYLAKTAQNYCNLDYINIPEVKELIKNNSIDFLVPGGNDLSYKICSQINNGCFYNIDSFEVSEVINNKEKFRKFSNELNLNIPRIIDPDKIYESLPVIIKPVDAYSGHGMTVIYEAKNDLIRDAIKSAKQFSKTKRYIVEEFIQGQLYSHSAFVIDKEIIIDFIVEEHCIVNPFVVDTSYVVFNFNKQLLQQIRNDISLLIKKLSLTDGLIHTQFISDGKSFWLIEVTRRCPGDLYSKLIEYSTGFPYAEYYSRPFINQSKKPENFELNKSLVIRHTITVNSKVTFNSISFNYPINSLKLIPLSLTGDNINESPFSRIGLMFAHPKSRKEFINLLEKMKNRELYTIE